MAKEAKYSIVINGLKESVGQVDALNRQLDALEKRINALSSKNINIGTTGGKVNTSSLQETDKLEQQILATEQKIAMTRDKGYQDLVKLKDELKAAKSEAEGLAASSKLMDNNYSNTTMAGLKEQLKDIKRVINTTDIDSPMFKQLVEEANTINNKLKEIEQSYGQFGRNVGNYTNSFKEAFDGFTMKIGDTEVKFNNLRDATTQLKNAMGSLEVQEKGNTKEYNDLKKALEQVTKAMQRLQSSMKDVQNSSKFMDKLLDSMTSFTALASVGKGLSAFFGIDNSEIDKSVQKLLALQNVLQGIETIRRQMNTSEGIGMLLSRGNAAVDKFANSLFNVKIAADGVTKSSKLATVAARGLSLALKTLGVGLAITAITALINSISGVNEQVKKLTDSTAALDSKLKSVNKQYEYRMQILNNMFKSGALDYEDYVVESLKSENQLLQDNIELLSERQKAYNAEKGRSIGTALSYNPTRDVRRNVRQDYISTLAPIELKSNYGMFNTFETNESINTLGEAIKRYDELSEVVSIANDRLAEQDKVWDKIAAPISLTIKNIANLGNVYDKLDVETAKVMTKKEAEYALMNASARQMQLGTVIMNDYLTQISKLDLETEEGVKSLESLYNELNSGGTIAKIALNLDQYYEDEKTVEGIRNILNMVDRLRNRLSTGSTEFTNANRQWGIDAMKDGYSKTMAEIKKAEDDELANWLGNEAAKEAIIKKYNRQRIEAYKTESKAARDSQNEILNNRIQAMRDGLKKTLAQIEQERKERIEAAIDSERDVVEKTASINELMDRRVLDAKKEWAEKMEDIYTKMWTTIYETTADNEQRMKEVMIRNSQAGSEEQINKLIERLKLNNMAYSPDNSTYSNRTMELLGLSDKEVDDILQQYKNIKTARLVFYTESLEIQKKASKEQERLQKESLDIQYKTEVAAQNRSYAESVKALEKERDELIEGGEDEKEITERYNKWIEETTRNHNNTLEVMAKEHQANLRDIELEGSNDRQAIVENTNSSLISDYNEFYNRLQDKMQSLPIYDSAGFGIINMGATRKRNKELLESFKELSKDILVSKADLQRQLDDEEITFDYFTQANEELDNLQANVAESTEQIVNDSSANFGRFMESIQTYVQTAGQTLTGILQAIWDVQDNAYEREKEQIEKETEEYEEMLDKQKEITEKYKDDINSIEDELSSARGDRRQELIDQLNAQRAAQRASLQEERRIEKEKEKLDERAEKLETEQKKRQKQRDTTQAIINAALSISYAAANHWPIPAIPLVAAATALGAAQVAAIRAQKYAQGGIIEGKAHSQGGVKVLGGRAEVEGGEYIVNKRTTAKNAPLLSYINAKDKKIELEDIVDFYSTGVRRTIHAVSPQRKFADGGVIPTLNNDLTFNDRLLDSFERYSNRPVVVSVVEIEDRMADVNSVRALAGLTD